MSITDGSTKQSAYRPLPSKTCSEVDVCPKLGVLLAPPVLSALSGLAAKANRPRMKLCAEPVQTVGVGRSLRKQWSTRGRGAQSDIIDSAKKDGGFKGGTRI